MPSKLTSTTIRLSQTVALRQKAQQVAGPGPQTIAIKGPFTGFMPDVDPNLVDGTSFNALQNVLARSHGSEHGEVLGLPDGYRQLDSARLPLGDGATLPAAPVTDADPVIRVDQIARFAPTAHANPGEYTGEFSLTPMAVTAGTTGGATNGSGNMYRISPATGQWTQVAPAVTVTAPRQLKADRDGRASSPSMPDSCTAPFGATARVRNTGGGADDLQSGPINEPCWIFTNDSDEVMVFPSNSGAVDGTLTAVAVHAYEPLCDSTSSAALDPFKCKSVETWNGRVYFWNTSEAGTRRPLRLRRTPKFTADPSTALVGGGFYDFRDFQGEGLRIETLGDVLAVYASDGVAFLRPTGVPTNPDEPQIISTERGLLATHAITAMGRNVHFGIFTDGWWLLDQSGRWQEIGVVNLDGKVVPKWRETFYSLIPANYRHRLYVYYDQPANLVYIAVPTSDANSPEQVWIYDPASDRVFIENYPVTCFGTYTPVTQAGVQIDSLVGTIDSQVGTIDSFGAVPGFPKVRVHGDPSGYVYKHDRALAGYDSAAHLPTVQSPQWSFGMGLRSPAGFRNLVTVDRVSIEYFNHRNHNIVSLEIAGPSVDGVQTSSVVLDQGGNEDLQYADIWLRYSSVAPGLTLSSVGEFHIRGLAIDLWSDSIEPRA